jgi:hypothetical protein
MARTRDLPNTVLQPGGAAAPVEVGHGAPSGNGSPVAAVPGDSSARDAHPSFDPQRLALVVAATANEPTQATVVANLAASFVIGGRKVTVLRIGFPARHGGAGESDEAVPGGAPSTRETSVPGIRLMEWQPEYGGPTPAKVFEDLQRDGDVVLVDAPRVSTAEFAEIAPLVDGVVVVCQSRRTSIESAERTADIVAWSRARLLGVVLTQVPVNAVERATWGRWRRSPLTSRGRLPFLHSGEGRHAGRRGDDELGLLGTDGSQQ